MYDDQDLFSKHTNTICYPNYESKAFLFHKMRSNIHLSHCYFKII
jgi:hypothetical protein